MSRKRFSEDALVRLLDFCDERGLRLGQAVVNILQQSFPICGANGDVVIRYEANIAMSMLFNMENENLEKTILDWIEREEKRWRVKDIREAVKA